MAWPSGARASCTCWASSRVGTRTRPRGARRPCLTSAPTRASSGRPKARVLPEPVAALPSTSRPARASGRAEVWMANGRWMPRRSSAVTSGWGRPSWWNVGPAGSAGASTDVVLGGGLQGVNDVVRLERDRVDQSHAGWGSDTARSAARERGRRGSIPASSLAIVCAQGWNAGSARMRSCPDKPSGRMTGRCAGTPRLAAKMPRDSPRGWPSPHAGSAAPRTRAARRSASSRFRSASPRKAPGEGTLGDRLDVVPGPAERRGDVGDLAARRHRRSSGGCRC